MVEKLALENLTFDSFHPYTGQKFSVENKPESTGLQLMSADARTLNLTANETRIAFSLMFKSDQQYVLPQGSYCLANEKFGSVEIFLVPIERDAEGVTYKAVFN